MESKATNGIRRNKIYKHTRKNIRKKYRKIIWKNIKNKCIKIRNVQKMSIFILFNIWTKTKRKRRIKNKKYKYRNIYA